MPKRAAELSDLQSDSNNGKLTYMLGIAGSFSGFIENKTPIPRYIELEFH